MARYADIDVLLEHLTTSDEGNFRTAITQWLEMHQVEDVAPVVHAHWLTSMEKFEKNWFAMDRCSNCSWLKPILVEGDEISFNYCPNCGAKMDEEVNK